MARRKRIPYDPPSQRKKRRRYDGWLRSDQVLLNRRLLMAKGLTVGAFAALGGKLGYMQLAEGDKYKAQAEANVITDEQLPAARGLILDRQGRTLAGNIRSWEVRVVPAKLPEEDEDRAYVINTLTTALQLDDVLVIDPTALPEGSADTVYQRVATMLSYKDADAQTAIDGWKYRATLGMVDVSNLSVDDAARFRAAKAELPGVSVMNEIDFKITNIWDKNLEVSIKTNVPREIAMTLDANSMYLPGVILDDSKLVRKYAGGDVMSHVVGYVQGVDSVELFDPMNKDRDGNSLYALNDLIGRAGLEQALEADLRGVKGARSVERDANGVQVRVLPDGQKEPQAGKNVTLTIDLEFQNAVAKALEEQIGKAAAAKQKVNDTRKKDGKSEWKIPNAGAVVALDPRSGEVLAMVSYPYYDNTLFVSGLSSLKWAEYMDPDRGKAFVNRCTAEVYPPGSTFKSFLAASALQRGAITTETTHTCAGGIAIPATYNQADLSKWACWVAWNSGGTPHGELDVYGALEQSCDVFFYNVAPSKTSTGQGDSYVYYFDYNYWAGQVIDNTQHVFDGEGIENVSTDMRTKFFFGRQTGIELYDEPGLVPDPEWKKTAIPGESWTVGDTLNVSIGQGEFQATPLQMAMNVAGIAADGVFKTPHLVLQKTDANGKVEESPSRDAGKLGFKQEHIDVVKEGMRRVCNEQAGTAFGSTDTNGAFHSKWSLTNPDGEDKITVAGKTGTAEFGQEDENGGARDTHAWFTAYAPADAPEIAVAVVIEAGGEGATFAVPVADATIRAYLELTGKRTRGTVLSKDKLAIS
ncbi:MAG: penicillin-binding transpeptidase domain-containing protein [Thermomicrobiales bacterium]